MNALHALAMNKAPRCKAAQAECARILVETHKIDLFAKNIFGHTPRQVAELRGNQAVADLLKELESKPYCLWSFVGKAYAAKQSFNEWLGYNTETATSVHESTTIAKPSV